MHKYENEEKELGCLTECKVTAVTRKRHAFHREFDTCRGQTLRDVCLHCQPIPLSVESQLTHSTRLHTLVDSPPETWYPRSVPDRLNFPLAGR
jgi:hypothetical protein